MMDEKMIVAENGYEVLREYVVQTPTGQQVVREHYCFMYTIELVISNPVIIADGVDAAVIMATVRRYDGVIYTGEYNILYRVNGEYVEAGANGLTVTATIPTKIKIEAEAVGIVATPAVGEVEAVAKA